MTPMLLNNFVLSFQRLVEVTLRTLACEVSAFTREVRIGLELGKKRKDSDANTQGAAFLVKKLNLLLTNMVEVLWGEIILN
jgi:hypothetical protein